MLVHVFDTLHSTEEQEEGSTFFPLFLLRAARASKVSSRRDGEYLVLEGLKKKKTKKRKFKVEWSSGVLYQKLRAVPASVSLPIIWRMCRYYYGSHRIDAVDNTLREHLQKELRVVVERSPFTLANNGSLVTCCQKSKVTLPKEVDPDQVEFQVDNQSLDVILLPHHGVAQALLLLLKEFL